MLPTQPSYFQELVPRWMPRSASGRCAGARRFAYGVLSEPKSGRVMNNSVAFQLRTLFWSDFLLDSVVTIAVPGIPAALMVSCKSRLPELGGRMPHSTRLTYPIFP